MICDAHKISKTCSFLTTCTVHEHGRKPIAHLSTQFQRKPKPSKKMPELLPGNNDRIILYHAKGVMCQFPTAVVYVVQQGIWHVYEGRRALYRRKKMGTGEENEGKRYFRSSGEGVRRGYVGVLDLIFRASLRRYLDSRSTQYCRISPDLGQECQICSGLRLRHPRGPLAISASGE